MMDRIACFVTGLLFAFYGYRMLVGEVSWREVPVSKWVGYVAIPIGAIFIIGSFFIKKKRPFGEASICPQCLGPYPEDLLGTPCPQCGTPLENMEGFYERHPELKDATKKADDNVHTE